MMKKVMLLVVSGLMMLNLAGCFALIAGVAGGAGTAVWLSGKLTQEFHASYFSTINATKVAMQSMNLPVLKDTQDANVAQIKSVYHDGRDIWIDIHRLTEQSTKVEVRVGAAHPDKDAAGAILKKIQDSL